MPVESILAPAVQGWDSEVECDSSCGSTRRPRTTARKSETRYISLLSCYVESPIMRPVMRAENQ